MAWTTGGEDDPAASAAFDLCSIIRKGDKSEAQKAELRRVRFANDQSTPAPGPPLPRRSEARPGGVLVTRNKAKALAAFHSHQSASAETAAEASSGGSSRPQRQATAAAPAAAAGGADVDGGGRAMAARA